MTPQETARAWLADPLGVVLDTETTALDGYCVELAVVDMEGRALVWERLWPGDDVQMHPGAEAVHGITLDSLKAAPTFAGLQERLHAALHDKNVVAYNAAFDKAVFEREQARAGWAWTPASWRCAMLLWGQHLGVRRWQKLVGGDHSALGDARACLEVVRRIAEGGPAGAR